MKSIRKSESRPVGRLFQLFAIMAIVAPAAVFATPILNFPTGFAGSTATLNFNGSAQIAATSRARLTNGPPLQVGSVWSKSQVDIRKFNCQFDFQFPAGGGDLEDGITFAIQRAGNFVTGYPYDRMGFAPICPSLAVKFDTWGATGSHVVSTTGVYLNGAYPSDDPPASIDMLASGIDLHSGRTFRVVLTYDGTTLHQTVTDLTTSASFTRDYVIDIPTTIGGIDAFVGFTGSTGNNATSYTQDVLNWTYSVTPSAFDVNFTAFPEPLQLYPRDRVTNTATIPVAGSEVMGGYTQAILRVYRNGVQVGSDLVQALIYSGGAAHFSFAPTIVAETAHYDVELLLRNSLNNVTSAARTQDIVAGDVIVIQGQSNAVAKTISGSASAYISPFVRTIGIESDWPPAAPSTASWMVATGDGILGTDSIGDIGQWGLVMGNQIMTTNNVPVAVINAGFGGQMIAFFQRNDANHTDLNTNYGRLLYRLQAAGLASAVRTILYYQGESDKGAAATHQAGFTALHSDWLEDYPSVERYYVFQVRETASPGICAGDVARFDIDLRNRQRLFADQFANLSVMSTTGLDGHEGCHFYFTNGYESLGFNVARVLQRDLYGGPSLPNTDAPNAAYAVLTGATHNIIRVPLRNKNDTVNFDAGAKADFTIIGTGVSIVSGTVSNGVLQLNLSGNATGATYVVYTGHSGIASGNWVANANGIGLLCFNEALLTDTTPPVITRVGANPVVVSLGGTYVDPGATATDNLDGNLTSSIVVNSSAVNTSVPGDYTVTYNVSDVAGNAATQVTRTVHVAANNPPTANGQSVTTSEDTAKSITLTGGDPEGDPITFSVVTGPAHGALSGTAPNLTYTPAANYNGPDSFTFRTNDGSSNSSVATVSITVLAVNDAPVANAQSITTNEDTAKSITLTGSDVDGDVLTFSVVAGPAHGTLSGTIPNLTYTPAANYHGSDNFTFKVNDGTVNSNVATVSITVTAVNDPPVANAQSVTTNEDTAKSITLTGSDVDGDALTFLVVAGPTHGALSGTAPNLTYTPAANYHGSDSFTFKVNDGTVDSNVATVSITVTAVNDAPIANAQSVTTNEDTAKNITLTGSDIDGDTLSFSVVAAPTHGALSGTAPNLTYTPATNYNGPDSFTFKVNDGTVDSNVATVSITVDPVNDAPTISNIADVATAEDTATGAISFTVGDVETAPGLLIVSGTSDNTILVPNANIVFGGSGASRTVTITPAANQNGTATITINVSDGADSASDNFVLTVNAVNDAPIANAQSVSTNEDTAKNITLTGSDIDGDTLAFSVVATPTHGVLSGTAPNLIYTPATNYDGPDSFTFKANDGTIDSNVATVSLTVTPVNDAPIANAQSVTTNEDTAKSITLTGSDIDGDTLTFSVVAAPTHGALSGTAPNLTYTPAANYNGSDSFTFKVNDGTVDSSVATVSVTVTAVNDAPVANAQSVTTNEDTAKSITLTGSDIDGDTLSFSVVAGPTHGALSGTAPNLTYTPAANYNGSDSFTFKANDGTVNSNVATVSITVDPVNDAPAANAQSVTTDENTAKTITLTGSDLETSSGSLSFLVTVSPAHGSLSGTAPNLTYTPTAGYNGSDSFKFTVTDTGDGASPALTSSEANVSITVNALPSFSIDDVTKVEGSTGTTAFVFTVTKTGITGLSSSVQFTTQDGSATVADNDYIANNGTLNFAFDETSKQITVQVKGDLTNEANENFAVHLFGAINATISDADGLGTITNDDNVPSFSINDVTHLEGQSGPTTYIFTVTKTGATALDAAVEFATMDGSATTADSDYQSASGTLHFDPSDVTKTITVQVTGDKLVEPNETFIVHLSNPTGAVIVDGDGDGVIENDDHAPQAQAVTTSTGSRMTKTVTLTGTDTDGDTLSFSVVTGPTHGVLGTITGSDCAAGTCTATIDYTPNDGYAGPDSFTYKANDGANDSAAATVSVTTNPSTDAELAELITSAGVFSPPFSRGTFSYTDNVPNSTTSATLTPTTSDSTATVKVNGVAVVSGTPSDPIPLNVGPNFIAILVTAQDGVTTDTYDVTIDRAGVPEIAVEEPADVDLSNGTSVVDFGMVGPGGDNSHTFTIKNSGTADLTGLTITFDGAAADDFTITSNPTAPVVPGGSTTFTIKFAPTALGVRSAVLHIANNDADESPFDVAVTGTGLTSLEAWRLQYFGSIDNSGAGADTADFEPDGISNLMEFATGNDPKQSNQMPGELGVNGGVLEFTYTRAKAAINDGITFHVEWSDELVPPAWGSAGVSEEILSEDSTLQQVKASVPRGNGGKRFLRLRVARPE